MTAEVMLHIKKKIIASIPPPILSDALRTFGPNKINKQISNIKSLRCIAWLALSKLIGTISTEENHSDHDIIEKINI